MSSSLTFPLIHSLHLKPHHCFPFSVSVSSPLKLSSPSLAKSVVCNSSNHANNDREEVRWIREEQRWFREEERWIREEQRWARERESLIREIDELKLRIQALERQKSVQGGTVSVSEAVVKIAGLLKVSKEKNLITERLLNENVCNEELELEKKAIVEEVLRFSQQSKAEEEVKNERRTLRNGSEGAEVHAMQEALLRFGFYSGEEDMEFSSFSSGTERAVKTWQAAAGIPEDGIMTAELLEMLYTQKVTQSAESYVKTDQKGNIPTVHKGDEKNGAVVTSVTEISDMKKTVVKEGGANVEVAQHRVFLLGENRWEDPSRIHSTNGKIVDGKTKNTSTKCLTCRGEGRLLCTECDGSGEPNIEPQFLEWVGEETKCPYCEGHGYSICDECEGKAVT